MQGTEPARVWTTKDKIAEGNRLKDEGNQFVKSGELKKALKSYKTVFLYINGLISKENQAMAKFAGNGIINDQDDLAIKELKTNTHSNIALCYSKLGQLDKVVDHCNRALEVNPNHVKSLIRLGGTQTLLGKVDLAKIALLKAYELDSQNESVQKELKLLKLANEKAIALQREKEKKAFGGKFL
ncbi:hypothetical protein BASA81_005434 [Batrachochytrium salamandrivorans]|nr:hypothetical protein BASA81_005434 [Batrachochytrium salamandrivorans]